MNEVDVMMRFVILSVLTAFLSLPAQCAEFRTTTVRGVTYHYYPDTYFDDLKVTYCPHVHHQMEGMCEWLLSDLERRWNELFDRVYFSKAHDEGALKQLATDVAEISEKLLIESQNFKKDHPELFHPPPHMDASME